MRSESRQGRRARRSVVRVWNMGVSNCFSAIDLGLASCLSLPVFGFGFERLAKLELSFFV